MKVFNVKDGLGISRLTQNGYQAAIITGRQSPFVTRRAADLGIQHVFQGVMEKLSVFEALLQALRLEAQEVAYMGDDWIDIPVLKRVGCAACPKDAIPCVKEICGFISQFNGGYGAARELCDAIWEAQHPCGI